MRPGMGGRCILQGFRGRLCGYSHPYMLHMAPPRLCLGGFEGGLAHHGVQRCCFAPLFEAGAQCHWCVPSLAFSVMWCIASMRACLSCMVGGAHRHSMMWAVLVFGRVLCLPVCCCHKPGCIESCLEKQHLLLRAVCPGPSVALI